MNYAKRKATTIASISQVDCEAQRYSSCMTLKMLLNWKKIANELVINWTMAKEGLKQIEVAGLGDKRDYSCIFAASMTCDFLPLQIIYAGKTRCCLQNTKFPNTWDITYKENHWANEITTEAHIMKDLVP